MNGLHTHSTWWSGAARATPIVLVPTAVFAVVALGVSIAYSDVVAEQKPELDVATGYVLNCALPST